MRYSLAVLMLFAVLPHSRASPLPKRINATPAVINAGTETNARWIQERLVSFAHIAILRDKNVAESAIVRRHVRDPEDTKELISWLEKNICIERIKSKHLIRVSFQDGNAKEQAAIINVVVEYFLTNSVKPRRDSLTRTLKIKKAVIDTESRHGKLTPEETAKAEETIKKCEEHIRTLPALVEHAKAP